MVRDPPDGSAALRDCDGLSAGESPAKAWGEI